MFERNAMDRLRPAVLVLVIIAAVVLLILLSHGIRVRVEWGTSGFVVGLICGVLLMLEIRHRRKRSDKA
jgi:peptidoglycan/LPS O-acetylase OafA/YrhL